MLLFNNQKKGLKLALVEELEAHLHPQYQLRLIDYISSQQNNEQFILSTHSITLASKIRLENLIVLKDKEAYPMSDTMMKPADYKFLERFLDATKANLFFAKGLIMVEGEAENLLIPAIAELMGKPLHKYGVSIVNIGSTAYKRYVDIFKRKDGKIFNMPIAVISDLDVRALEYYDDNSKDRKTPLYWLKDTILNELKAITEEVNYDAMANVYGSLTAFDNEVRANKTNNFAPIGDTINRMKDVLKEDKKIKLNEAMLSTIREEKTKRLENEINKGKTKIFLSKDWTLEYEIAGSGLYRLLVIAIKLSNIEKNNPDFELTDERLLELWSEVKEKYPDDHNPSRKESYKIFAPLNDGTVSKAITAQYLAGMITGQLPPIKGNDELKEKIKGIIENDKRLEYIKTAIEYVTL